MWSYLLRRIAQILPILIGVNIITFALFFFVNSPDDIANVHLGGKYVTQEARNNWKHEHGYDLPLFYNDKESGLNTFSKTIFFEKSIKLFIFEFGTSDTGRDITQAISERYLPSLKLAIPAFILGIVLNIFVALILLFFKETYLDTWGIFLCVVLISISAMFYIILGQFVFAKLLRLVPISGYAEGWYGVKFFVLPIFVSIFSGLGPGARWYRAIFLEELHQDYVRTARAKGLSNFRVLFKHVLRNGLIPILTGVVSVLPLLFMGSLLLESFFAIPGLGSYTMDAIHDQDFAVVRVMVFLGTVFFILGLLLTDISYTMVDPRVHLS